MNNQLKVQKSSLAFHKNLAVFSPPVTDVTSGSYEIVIFNNKNPLEDNKVLIILEGIRNQLIDLYNTKLVIKGKIVNEDGSDIISRPTALWSTTALTGDENKNKEDTRKENQEKFKKCDVFPVNNLFHSLFKDGTLSIQNTKFYLNDIAYRGILEAYTKNRFHSNSQLINQLYSPPRLKSSDDQSVIVGHPKYTSDGEILYTYTEGSNEVELCGPLLFGLCRQERFLISHVDVKIELLKHYPDFFLRHSHGNKYKFVFSDIKLLVPLKSLAPDIEIGHAEVLQQRPALYPFIDKKLTVHTIKAGSHYFEHNDTWNGDVPSQLTVVMLPSKNYNGSFDSDPFGFEHNYVNVASFSVDNLPVAGKVMKLNIKESEKKSQILDAYSSITDKFPKMELSREGWFKCFPAFHFDISNCNNNDIMPLVRKGMTKLLLNFSRPLEKDTIVILYAESPTMVEIDSIRNVTI